MAEIPRLVERLSETERQIVDTTLRNLSDQDWPKIRQMHKAAIRRVGPRYLAAERALAMHQAALERLDQIEAGTWSPDQP